MNQTKNNHKDSSNFFIIVLFSLLGKCFYDFKMMDGFSNPLLIKILYMILFIFFLIIIFHPGEIKNSIKQAKIEDYFNKFK